jgi:hypothetical protein
MFKKNGLNLYSQFRQYNYILENTGFSTFMVLGINGDELGLWQFPVESVVGGNRKIIVTNEGEIFGLRNIQNWYCWQHPSIPVHVIEV